MAHLKQHELLNGDDHLFGGVSPLESVRLSSDGTALVAYDSSIRVETLTLNEGHITAKQVELAEIPISGTVQVTVRGGPDQFLGVDFSVVSGDPTFISWSGLGLDGQLVAGDVLAISYSA